jgi:SAM-dependent methyltransferase
MNVVGNSESEGENMAISDSPILLGSAQRVFDLFDGNLPVFYMFAEEGATLYDNFSRNDRSEVPEFLRIGGPAPKQVLELACGNGRTSLPLLEAGWELVGLDSSADMLGRLAARFEEPAWQPYADKMETVQGDMTSFALHRQFDLVVLGTSTVWMLSADARASLFKSVYEHLKDDGRFLLTLMHFPSLGASSLEIATPFIGQGTTGPALCTLYDHVDPARKVRATSILAHHIEDGRISRSGIYATSMNLITPDELIAEIEQSGLAFVARHEVDRGQLVKQSVKTDPNTRHWVLLEAQRKSL